MRILDANVTVGCGDVCVFVVLETFLGVVGEDDKGGRCLETVSSSHGGWESVRTYSAVCAVFCLVKGSHAKTADVTGCVVAWRNGVVCNGIGADEADFGV